MISFLSSCSSFARPFYHCDDLSHGLSLGESEWKQPIRYLIKIDSLDPLLSAVWLWEGAG